MADQEAPDWGDSHDASAAAPEAEIEADQVKQESPQLPKTEETENDPAQAALADPVEAKTETQEPEVNPVRPQVKSKLKV